MRNTDAADLLRASIREAGHTQPQVARLLGVSLRTVEAWLSGQNPIPPAMLMLYRHLAGLERIPFKR